jgi:N-hydroxyarylamine O-acetyltransferase
LNPTAYLQRIRYTGALIPHAETLRALHRAHMLTVPFENLSIHARERIQLNYEWLFDKIVTRGRGGFCYELNGLFGWLLAELGFRVEMLSARVAHPDGSCGPKFDHMVLLVHLDEPWLVDVGFGDSYLEPIRLDFREEQADPAGIFRIVALEGELGMQEWVDGKFETQHFFTLTPHPLADYEAMCHFHQTSPESSFTRKIVCSKATLDGRVTVSGNRLIITDKDAREEHVLRDEIEMQNALKKHFGLTLSSGPKPEEGVQTIDHNYPP